MKRAWSILFFFWVFFYSTAVFAACTPAASPGDDTVTCSGTVNNVQDFLGGNDRVTLNNVNGNAYYSMDKHWNGDPTTDGNDTFYASDSHFFWVFASRGDDNFDINNSTFSNLYADIGYGVYDQRGNDTIIIRNSVSNGWILGGNDNDRIEIKDSNVSQVVAGYPDVYSVNYSPYDGNDTVLLDNVNFTAINYYTPSLPGFVSTGDGDDRIEMIHGGEAFNVTGDYGNDIIIIKDGEHFNACNYTDWAGRAERCGIYGDVSYVIEHDPNVGHDDNYIASHHGDDQIILENADIRGIIVNGNHGSDIITIHTPVQLSGATIDGGDDTAIADTFVDLVEFDQWIGDLNGSQFHNCEQIRLHNGSSVTLLDDNITAGLDSGIDAASGLPYGIIIDDNSQLNLYHDFKIFGNLHNRSILNLQDGNASGATVTVLGNYTTNGGSFYIDTVLNDATPSLSDKLIVEGNTSGTTTLYIDNTGGTGGQTPTADNTGILVVEVQGSSDGIFVLSGQLDAEDYWYHLVKGSNGNWYLQSELKVAALTLSKTVDKASISSPQTLTYTLELNNTGNIALTGITLTDTLPDGSTTTLVLQSGDDNSNGALDLSELWIYTATYAATQADINSGADLINYAEANISQGVSVEDNATTTVVQNPALAATKVMLHNADEDGSGDVTLGDTLTYEVNATNMGNVTLYNVIIKDDRITPATVTCVDLLPGESCILSGNYTVVASDIDAGKIENIATVKSDVTVELQRRNTVLTGSYAPPVAIDDTNITVTSYAPFTLNVLANDIWDKAHCTLSAFTYTQPTHGSVALDDNGTPGDPSDDRLVYTPTADVNNIVEQFSYTISDCVGQKDSAVVTVRVACVTSQASDGGSALTIISLLLLSMGMLVTGLHRVARESEER